jgi:hypothetical protein
MVWAYLPFTDGCRWIGLDRGMPTQDAAAILGEILGDADALIRQPLKDRGLELPHLVFAVTRRTVRWSCAATSARMFYGRLVKT